MIVGFAIAWVESRRFERARARFGARLDARLFSPGELRRAARRRRGSDGLAARFAAKCAAGRALGLAAPAWSEIEVVRAPGEPPGLRLRGRAAQAAQARGVARARLSITHEPSACAAHVVLEGAP